MTRAANAHQIPARGNQLMKLGWGVVLFPVGPSPGRWTEINKKGCF